ncbi:hypothetical protein ICN84_02620 [Akkermansia glycaniphila]|uniref:hypothetical protein n=1 Tax=Akkermansia glycaniphila TaxID=1679444 RepID=UPI001C026A9B|nr:hypothetical protein [Akkermansia glycaniphila]MBT9448964.1 hypothetical protein [Akkermansia glycaniphila]
MSWVYEQLQHGLKMRRLRAAAVLALAGWVLPWLALPASAGVVVTVPDDGFRSVWHEWKKTIGEQLYVLELEGENESLEKVSLWRAVPQAVCLMLLKYEEEELYNRMYAEEDELLAAYAESGQAIPDAVVARLKEMIGRYADAKSKIGRKQGEFGSRMCIVSSAGFHFINPYKDFRKRMAQELSDLFFVYSISNRINMSDAELKALFLRRVRERNMVWQKRRATTPPERQQTVALPRMYGGEREFPYTNGSTTSMTHSFQHGHAYTTTR